MIGVIGYGVVGMATAEAFGKINQVLWHDPFKKGSTPLAKLISSCEYFFFCLPTPMFSDYSGIDLSLVDTMMDKVASKIGGTEKKYPKVRFAMNPEFLTEVNAPWDFTHPDRRDGEIYEQLLYGHQNYFC